MAFFSDSTVRDIVQANIEKVGELEDEQQEKLLRVFKKVRQQLLDRLSTIPQGTFTEQQLNVTLVQISAAIEAIKRELTGEMANASEILAEKGINDLVDEVQKMTKHFEKSVQPLNLNTALISQESQNFLVNKHEASIAAYTEALRADITSRISQSMIARDTTQRTVDQLVAGVGRYFAGEEWRLRRIVRTELHNIYNFAKLNSMKEAGKVVPGLKKTLVHPMDDRTGEDSKELKRENPIVDMSQPFRFKWKDTVRVFMFPPDRPNDRSILVPVKDSWNN